MLLMIDNYDSFVVNLARYCERLGRKVSLFRHDKITLEEIEVMSPKAIIHRKKPVSLWMFYGNFLARYLF